MIRLVARSTTTVAAKNGVETSALLAGSPRGNLNRKFRPRRASRGRSHRVQDRAPTRAAALLGLHQRPMTLPHSSAASSES